MKKIIAFVLCLVMLFSSFSASALSLDFLKKPYTNYTSESVVTISFDNAEEFFDAIELLGDTELFEENGTVDFEMLLSSLAQGNQTSFIQSDISEDYKKIKAAIKSDSLYSMDVNENLNVSVDANSGIWLDIDIANMMEPKCQVVVSSPAFKDYVYFDILELLLPMLEEDDRMLLMYILYSFLNEEFVSSVNDYVVERYEMYGTVTEEDGVYTVKLDNEGFLKFVDDMLVFIVNEAVGFLSMGQPVEETFDVPSIADTGLQLLGENGYVLKFTLDGENVSTCEYECDIELSFKNISEIMDEEYTLEEDITLEFTVKGTEKISEVGTTTVEYPSLTEENSVTLMELMDELLGDGHMYPYYWVEFGTDYIPAGETVYVPFEALMQNAYGDTVEITYDSGTVTAVSEYFEDFATLKFALDSTVASLDETSVEFEGAVLYDKDAVFVSESFIKEVFGWELYDLEYDMIEGTYYFEFDTDPYEYDWDDEDYYDDDDYYEEEVTYYPNEEVFIKTDFLPVVDRQLYVPFREVMEQAYGESAVISYDNGAITVTSDYFVDFKKLSFAVGDNKVFADEKEIGVGNIILVDGTTYVTTEFFVSVFGFSLDSAFYDYPTDMFTVWYETEPYEFEYPYYWPSIYAEYVPSSDTCIYIPLEEMIYDAYDDSVIFTKQDGSITMTCKYFTEFGSIVLTADSSVAVVDGVEIELGGKVLVENDVVYVPSALFEKVFGWTLIEATYCITDNDYYFEFESFE